MPKSMMGFRPTEKSQDVIKAYIKENKVNQTQAINELIAKSSKLGDAPTLGEGTGIIVQCPIRPLPFPIDNPIMKLRLPVDSSVCKTCSKYPCDSWGHVESWAKYSPKTAIATTP